MSRFVLTNRDLFGNVDDRVSEAEYYIYDYIFSNDQEIVGRAQWCWENIPLRDEILLDLEDAFLMDEVLKCYIFGFYASVIIGSMGFCERLITDNVETHCGIKKKNNSFKEMIGVAEKEKLIAPYIAARMKRMYEIRNNLCHERGGDDKMRLFRRELSERRHHIAIMKSDAQEALCMMRGIARDIERWFPRLDLPGLPNAKKQR